MSVDFADSLRTERHDNQHAADGVLAGHQFTDVHGPSGFHAARCDCGAEFITRDAAGIDRQHEQHLECVLDCAEYELVDALWATEPARDDA